MKDPIQFYNKKIPDVEEVVMIRFDDISDNCIYVTLMEYNISGIIIFKELSRRRVKTKNLRQLAPIGRTVPAVVTNESNAETITLTRKRITEDEINEFSEKYKKNRKVISILENLSHTTNMSFNEILINILHVLDKKYIETEQYESVFDLMKESYTNLEYLDDLELDQTIISKFKELIIKNFPKEVEKIQLKVALVSNSINGINTIKEIFAEIQKDFPEIKIFLDKTPYYVIELLHNHDSQLQKIKEYIQTKMLEDNGIFKEIK